MKWLNQIIVHIISIFPQSFIWVFSRRYIAGKTLDQAVKTAKALNAQGCLVTMDVLGEDITSMDEAGDAKEECMRVLKVIKEHKIQGGLSVKLTQLGLQMDQEACFNHIRDIVVTAKKEGLFVRIDMEDHTCTDATLEVYQRLCKEFDNVGAVIQAYMIRSQDDVNALIRGKIANLRLCKGIYNEPKEIAFKKKQKVRDNFKDLIYMTLDSHSFAAIATHDKQMIKRSLQIIDQLKVTNNQYEFQMLLGVTEKLREKLISEGHSMRIYVPYGDQWYAYSMRRLKENPALAGHIIKNLFIKN